MTGDWFDVVAGVRQDCILSALLFVTVMDWIMKKSLKNFEGRLEWIDGSGLCDLDYADDIALIETLTGMPQLTREIERASGSVGLRMNTERCKIIMVSNDWEDDIRQ